METLEDSDSIIDVSAKEAILTHRNNSYTHMT